MRRNLRKNILLPKTAEGELVYDFLTKSGHSQGQLVCALVADYLAKCEINTTEDLARLDASQCKFLAEQGIKNSANPLKIGTSSNNLAETLISALASISNPALKEQVFNREEDVSTPGTVSPTMVQPSTLYSTNNVISSNNANISAEEPMYESDEEEEYAELDEDLDGIDTGVLSALDLFKQ